MNERKRKVRKDKKRDVKPTVPENLRECIYRLSYITNTPVKDVAESICDAGIRSTKVMEYLSNYFRRPFNFGETVYIGELSRLPYHNNRPKEKKERITLRLRNGEGETYEIIRQLAYSLDCTPSKATAILLEVSIKNKEFLNEYIKGQLEGQLDSNRIKQLREVLAYINQNNPYKEEVSLNSLVFPIA